MNGKQRQATEGNREVAPPEGWPRMRVAAGRGSGATSRLHACMSVLMLALLFTGCATTQLVEEVPLNEEQAAAVMKRAKQSQAYGITLYRSEQGPVFAGAFRLHPNQFAELPFVSDRHSTAPIIRVEGGSRPVRMLIDTSAGDSWLSMSAARMMDAVALTANGPIPRIADHVYDTIGGFAAVAPKMKFDSLHMENCAVYIRNAVGPMTTLNRWETGEEVEGIIGMAQLRSFRYVQFDFQKRKVRLSSTIDYRPNEGLLLARVPLAGANNGPLTAEGMLDGEPGAFILDLAGDFEIISDTAEAPEAKQLSIGNLVIRNVRQESGYDIGLGNDSRVRVGRQILERFLITLDFARSEILFEKPGG